MNATLPTLAILCAALSACGGTSSTSTPSPLTTNPAKTAEFSSTDYPWNFASSISQMVVSGSGSGSTTATDVLISFTDLTGNQLDLTVNSTYIDQFTWDAQQNAYVGTQNGNKLYIYDSPDTPGVFTVRLAYTDPGVGVQGGYISISNSNTALADLPTSGSASYSGYVEATDNKANVASGTIDLTVNFTGGSVAGGVSGKITLGPGTVFGATTINLAPATIYETGTSGQSVAGFATTLSGDHVTAGQSRLDGTFSGTSAPGTSPQSVAGSFYAAGDVGSLVGAYSASLQTP